MNTIIKVDYINPFLLAAKSVFRSLLNVELKKGKMVKTENIEPTNDVIINIDFSGDLNGFVIYNMGFNTVHKIAEALVPGLSEDQVEDEYKDIIGEMANMITGNAINQLAENGISISTPVIMDREDFMLNRFRNYLILSINFYSPFGQIEIIIATKQAKKK
ncbi:MAG: chemotaxis protein CheX [Spirochaetota bacterium]|nr:chemotaxis protein CheX [Spirochaetota bacterium]